MAEAGLRERKKERTARAIQQAALAMIRGQGYEHVTVEAIVREVEVSQPTFYNYYSSLDDLLRTTARQIMDDWARASVGKVYRRASIRAILRARYRKLADEVAADPDLWRAIFLANALNPYDRTYRRDVDLELEKLQQATIHDGRKRGEINRAFSAEFLSRTLDAIQFSLCMDWCLGDRKDSLRRRLERGLDFFFRGAGSA